VIKGKGLLESRKTEIANESLPALGSVTVHVIKATQGDMQNKVPFLAQIISDKSITLSTETTPNSVIIKVSDTGAGIPEEDIKKIWGGNLMRVFKQVEEFAKSVN